MTPTSYPSIPASFPVISSSLSHLFYLVSCASLCFISLPTIFTYFPLYSFLFSLDLYHYSRLFFPILNSSSIYSFFTSFPCPHPILFPVSFFIPLWSYILFLLASFPTAHSFFPYHPRLLPLTLSALHHSLTFFISVSVLFVILTYPNPLFPFFHASLQYVLASLLSPLPLLLLNYLSLHPSVYSHPRSYPDAQF